MGLDMYLEARIYGGEYLGKDISDKLHAAAIDWPVKPSSFDVRANVIYWRKANQIHAWFVTNVQEGKDECEAHWVSIEKLQELHDLCNELLTSKNVEQAKEKLPPQAGFFFGSTEMDEGYWSDIEHTRDSLAPILAAAADTTKPRFDYYYCSSW